MLFFIPDLSWQRTRIGFLVSYVDRVAAGVTADWDAVRVDRASEPDVKFSG